MQHALDRNENIFGRTDVEDSVDKEVQELFMNAGGSHKSSGDSLARDISGGKEFEALQKKHKSSKTRNLEGEATDVNLEDLMKVSMATDFNPANPSDPPNL